VLPFVGSEVRKELTITSEQGGLSKEAIEKLIQEAELYAKEDEELRKKHGVKSQLEQLLYHTKSSITSELEGKLSKEDAERLTQECDSVEQWLQDLVVPSTSVEEMETKLKDFQETIKSIISNQSGSGDSTDYNTL